MGSTTNAAPGSCSDGGLSGGPVYVANQHLPYCLQIDVNVHNNYVTTNSSLGDELFSGTLSGGGGATFCTGNDYYKFNYNWVCGNLSAGEGGGLVHLGEIQDGDIEHNTFVLNQSQNPTVPTNGGGIQVQGTPDTDPICGVQLDADCPAGLSDGTGHGLVINANLIQANQSESGSGGGIRLQQVNGTDVSIFPTQPQYWNDVAITNNIIVNNVAGWDGAGISLQDSLKVQIVNNTIAHNDSLATSGVLTQSLGTPGASAPAGSCVQTGGSTSCPQSSGVTSTPNSSLMTTAITGETLTCPFALTRCAGFSNPYLLNDLIYQNRSFKVGVGALGTGTQNQQNLITLQYPSGTVAPSQTFSGECFPATDSYWDIGVRGDTGPTNHGSGYTISTHSTQVTSSTNPHFVSQYCNGSRVPPECSVTDGCGGPSGYGVPPGIVDSTTPNPVFTMTASATVDEGNNWVNVSWGPMAMANPAIQGTSGNWGAGLQLGNYALDSNSTFIDAIPTSETVAPGATVPATDFFGKPRPDPSNTTHIDYGAVEYQGNEAALTTSITSIAPNTGNVGTVVNVVITGTNLTGTSAMTISGTGVTVNGLGVVSNTTVDATLTISATAAGGARNISLTDAAGTTNTLPFTVIVPTPTLTGINPSSGVRGTTVTGVTLTGTNLTGGTIAISGTGVTANTIVVNPAGTSMTANFVITTGATVSARTVTVHVGALTSNGETFTVTAPGATISPAAGERGTTVPVTITGTNTNFIGTTAVTMNGGNVTCTITGTTTATQVTANCQILAGATRSARTVTVVNATHGNVTVSNTFEVTGATLTISAPTPAMNSGGTTVKTGTITVSNATGTTAGPFTFTATPTVAKSGGTGTGTFSVTGGTCTSTTVLATGGSCTISVTYTPLTSGANDTSNATGHVTVTGTGLATATQTGANFTAN